MSDTVKLIIEIPKSAYKMCQDLKTNNDDGIVGLCAVNSIANGTPLDDVRAEIREQQKEYQEWGWAYDDVLEILDNIGKAESEDKNDTNK